MAADPPKIATKEELKALLADRQEDPALTDEEGNLADWIQDPTHPDRQHAAARETQINRIEKALDRASEKLGLDWDTSS